jgi:zinc D-Ala-D-Ala carboxypeptidase
MTRRAATRAPRRHAALVLLLLAGLAAPAAASGASHGPPACAYGDAVVRADVHDDHATMVLDTTHRLSDDAVPRDLVSVADAGFSGGHLVRAVVIDDLAAMRRAAADAGLELALQSAFRSFAYQRQVHAGWVAALGAEGARRVSARPGHSEHQLGTAIDLRGASGPAPWDLEDWAATPEGAWVAANAHRFGFVMSYPAESEDVTCYAYEPWHYRWLGREVAAAVHASGLPLRAWLYAHHPPAEAP